MGGGVMAKTMSTKLNPYSAKPGKLLHMSQTHFTICIHIYK